MGVPPEGRIERLAHDFAGRAVVSSEGQIALPFVGRIAAAGRTLPQIEADITQQLNGRANDPQVLVRLIRNTTSSATVVGGANSAQVPITPRGERLVDAPFS